MNKYNVYTPAGIDKPALVVEAASWDIEDGCLVFYGPMDEAKEYYAERLRGFGAHSWHRVELVVEGE